MPTTKSVSALPLLVSCSRCDGEGFRNARRCARCEGAGELDVALLADDQLGAVRDVDGADAELLRRGFIGWAVDEAGETHAIGWDEDPAAFEPDFAFIAPIAAYLAERALLDAADNRFDLAPANDDVAFDARVRLASLLAERTAARAAGNEGRAENLSAEIAAHMTRYGVELGVFDDVDDVETVAAIAEYEAAPFAEAAQ